MGGLLQGSSPHKGTLFMVEDLDSGAKLLSDLGIEIPPVFPQLDLQVERLIWQKA